MRKSLGVLVCGVLLAFASLVQAAGSESSGPFKGGAIKEIVYLVLMSQSPPLHLIEMPDMEKCQAAARHTANAKCVATKAVGVRALKSKIGGVGHLRRLPARIPQRK